MFIIEIQHDEKSIRILVNVNITLLWYWLQRYCQMFLTIESNQSLYKSHIKGLSCAFSTTWRHQMETFSALLATCAGNSRVPGEFPTQRPVTGTFDVFFDLRMNKRLCKQWRGWWFETLLCPLWRHHNETRIHFILQIYTWKLYHGMALSINKNTFFLNAMVQWGYVACGPFY